MNFTWINHVELLVECQSSWITDSEVFRELWQEREKERKRKRGRGREERGEREKKEKIRKEGKKNNIPDENNLCNHVFQTGSHSILIIL